MYTMRDPVRRAEQLFAEREATVCGETRHTYRQLADASAVSPGCCRRAPTPGPGRPVVAELGPLPRVVHRHPVRRPGDRPAQHPLGRARAALRHDRRRRQGADLRPRPGRPGRRRRAGHPPRHRRVRRAAGRRAGASSRRSRRQPGRALLHRRHDRHVQGRDAHPRQPDGQRRAHPARPAARRRRPLPDDGADVPRRRRRTSRSSCRGSAPTNVDRAGVRSRRRARPHRRARRITCALAVPTMLAALVERQAADPRDVSACGGCRTAPRRSPSRCSAAPPRCSAASSSTSTGRPRCRRSPPCFRHEEQRLDGPRAKSCGQPAPGVDLRIVDADGRPVAAGEVGEVVVRGPNVMAGYWNKPEQTAAAMLDGGWYRTGDVGYLDDDGYLYLVDRAKDMIISGGENVYCTEVEDALYTHPAVLEATVFGIPDERWGEAVHAVVVPRGDATTEQALIEHCRGADRRLQGPQVDQLPARPPAEVRPRQGPQTQAPRALLGRPHPPDPLREEDFSSVFSVPRMAGNLPENSRNHAHQDPARRVGDADAVVQRHPRPAGAAPAAAAPGHPRAGRARRPRAAVPDGAHRAGGHRPSATSTSPAACSTCTGCGGRARCTAPTASSGCSTRRRGSSTSTRASARPARTSRTRRCRRRTTTTRRASGKLTTETGAGQWGTALAFAAAQYGIECEIWQVAASYRSKPYRRTMMEIYGRDAALQPVGGHRVRPRRCSPRTRTTTAASASPSPRPSPSPPPTRTRATRSAACSTTC